MNFVLEKVDFLVDTSTTFLVMNDDTSVPSISKLLLSLSLSVCIDRILSA